MIPLHKYLIKQGNYMSDNNSKGGWRQFLTLCLKFKNVDELDELFKLLLTIEEQNDIADRCLIVSELLKGKRTQREMSEQLHVSISKITRGSNALKIIDERLRKRISKYL